MKTVLLIGSPSAPLIYFVNHINSIHKVDLVVIEKKKPLVNKASRKKAPFSIEKVLQYMLFKIGVKKKARSAARVVSRNHQKAKEIFGDSCLKIESEIKTMLVDSINGDEVKKKLKEIQPDLLLDHGTALLSGDIIDAAKLSLNLHWGLSPYYRGVNCAQRALLNWDPYNIGVTVHKLAKKIDGGDILGQARVEIDDHDNIFSITAKKTLLGTEIIVKAIQNLKEGKELLFKKQEIEDGYLTRKKQWSPILQEYFDSIDADLIREMKKSPSRKSLPIIEF